MDVTTLARHLGIDEPRVIAKAKELVNLAKVRISGGLGPGEVCKPAICLELACQIMGYAGNGLARERFVKHGCVSAKVYTNTFNMLQQTLGAVRKVDLQQLVVKFGCASVRQSVLRVLELYKQRFVQALRTPDKANANFDRPVFLAVAFSLVARKNKIKVEPKALMETMCVPREDFLNISASMYELCFDVVGVEKTKKKAAERKTNSTVLDNHRKPAPEAGNDENAGPKAEGKSGTGELQQAGRKSATAAAGPSTSAPSAAAAPAAATAKATAAAPKARPAPKRSAQEGDEEWKLMALLGRLPPNELAAGGGGGKRPKLS